MAGDLPPVLIKGISTYLATAEPHTMRCGDIDLVCADGDRMIELLTGLGYRRTRGAFLHEIGEFTRGETEVDVHSHFPVHSYAGLRSDDVDPSRAQGVWHQIPHEMSQRPIKYSDLVRGRWQHRVNALEPISVPDPCLLAVILCAHTFMNFTNMWSISHRAKPYVRLGELADLQDLAIHPAFDTGRFQQLVERFDAADAVGWAAWASALLIGSHPRLSHETLQPELGIFPRCLWWSFWASVPVRPASLVRVDWLDMAQLVSALGENVVPLGGGTTETIRIDSSRLPRQIRQEGTGGMADHTVEIQLLDSRLTVTIGLPSKRGAVVERVRVDLGHAATEWSYDTEADRQMIVGGHTDHVLRSDGSGRQLQLRYDLACRTRSNGRISLLVGIAAEDATKSFVNSVLLPLSCTTGI